MTKNKCIFVLVCHFLSFLLEEQHTLSAALCTRSHVHIRRHKLHPGLRHLHSSRPQHLFSSYPYIDDIESDSGGTTSGVGRVRTWAVQARQHAKDVVQQATDQGLPLELGRLFLQEPNPTLARRLYAAVSPRGSPKTRPPGAKDIEITEEESDAKARRVREILDEYLVKAPQATQWPPGRRIRVRGVDLFYKDTGKRSTTSNAGQERPTFVLLHGLAGSTASWDEVVGDLAEYGRVISFDRPGFGKTERVMPPGGLPWRLCPQTLGENPYSASFAAKALFGILDRLGVDKIIIISHSLGAQVALRAARARPKMVRAMVLVAPAVLNPLDSKFTMDKNPNASLLSPLIELRTRVEVTARLAAFNFQLLQPGEAGLEVVRNITLNDDIEARVQQNFHDTSITAAKPELISKYLEPLTDPLWDRGLLHFYKTLQGEVQPGEQLLKSALEAWQGPSLVITGDQDPTVPAQASVYVAEEMEGRLVVIDSCAHIPMDEKGKVFSSAVLDFAKSDEVRSAWLDNRSDK